MDLWWAERAALARRALESGDVKTAYESVRRNEDTILLYDKGYLQRKRPVSATCTVSLSRAIIT